MLRTERRKTTKRCPRNTTTTSCYASCISLASLAALNVLVIGLWVPGAEADFDVNDAGVPVGACQVLQLQQCARILVLRHAICVRGGWQAHC